jgi:hypothetical protein
VYTCITFHFFALALGEKGVFNSYKKISMLHNTNYVTWKGVYTHRNYICSLLQVFYIITCSFSVFVENCVLLPKGIDEFVVFLCIVHVWFWFFIHSWLQYDRNIRLLIKFLTVYTCIIFHFFALGEKVISLRLGLGLGWRCRQKFLRNPNLNERRKE